MIQQNMHNVRTNNLSNNIPSCNNSDTNLENDDEINNIDNKGKPIINPITFCSFITMKQTEKNIITNIKVSLKAKEEYKSKLVNKRKK